MRNIFDGDAIASGLDEVDIQSMAKRQFFASVAAALVIGLGAILLATAPTPRGHAEVASHRSWTAQQPRFAGRISDKVAEAMQRRQMDLP